MSVISSNKHTNKLYYSSESNVGKQAQGYISASDNELLAIDVTKTKVTGTQWKELADNLGISIENLIDKEHPAFTDNYDENTSLDENDWIKVLNAHPEVLTYPIVIYGEEYLQLNNASDIEKYLQVDSEAIDEKKHI